jgi:hypothetical protein
MAGQATDYRAGDCATNASINFRTLGRFSFAASVVDNYDTRGRSGSRA